MMHAKMVTLSNRCHVAILHLDYRIHYLLYESHFFFLILEKKLPAYQIREMNLEYQRALISSQFLAFDLLHRLLACIRDFFFRFQPTRQGLFESINLYLVLAENEAQAIDSSRFYLASNLFDFSSSNIVGCLKLRSLRKWTTPHEPRWFPQRRHCWVHFQPLDYLHLTELLRFSNLVEYFPDQPLFH